MFFPFKSFLFFTSVVTHFCHFYNTFIYIFYIIGNKKMYIMSVAMLLLNPLRCKMHKYFWKTPAIGDGRLVPFVIQRVDWVIGTFAFSLDRPTKYPDIVVFDCNRLVARSATYQGV